MLVLIMVFHLAILIFEKYRDWRGICIEPMTKQFELLQATRSEKTIKINACVSDLADEKVDFIEVEGGACPSWATLRTPPCTGCS